MKQDQNVRRLVNKVSYVLKFHDHSWLFHWKNWPLSRGWQLGTRFSGRCRFREVQIRVDVWTVHPGQNKVAVVQRWLLVEVLTVTLKGLCHSGPVHFVLLILSITRPQSLSSKESTCKCQNQRSETNKHVSWALFLKLQAARTNFEKLLGWTVFKNPNFNAFKSSSVLPIRGICCFCYVFLTFL